MRFLVRPPRTRVSWHLIAIVTYLALSLVIWWHVWMGGDPTHAITCNCGDTIQQVWWFQWLPWALAHGHNPFFSDVLWARLGGMNVLSNTSWLAPAAVLTPITQWFGPVASFNVANLLAPVLSGWAAFALAGWITRRPVPRLVAGALYAFSPFVFHNTDLGHLDLTLTPYLPLVLILGLRLLTRDANPVRLGLALGAVTIVQFFTSLEVMALTAVTVVLGGAAVFLTDHGLWRAVRGRLVVASAVAGALCAVVLAYPLWFYLLGPRHVVGPYWKVGSANPLRIVLPGANIFRPDSGLIAVGYLGNRGANTDFLGFGLLVAVAGSWWLWRRRRACVVVAVVGVVSWILEFFPGWLWAKLPLLSSVDLVRFGLPVSLCVALLLAASVDLWWTNVARWSVTSRSVQRLWLARAGVVVATALAFVPLLDTYSVPLRVVTASVPEWYARVAPHLAKGTAVMSVPLTYSVASRPMAWQAETDDSFDLVGGWTFVPGGNGVNDQIMSPPRDPLASLRVMSRYPGCVTPVEQSVVRAAVLRWRPLVIVDDPQFALPESLVAWRDTLGLAPTRVDGMEVWHLYPTTVLGPPTPVAPTGACGRVG